jgi:dTDP-4-amino-4,6-dideoxygalactose transaminase
MIPTRIFLSPPHMSGKEIYFVKEAFDSNYIAPLGPQVDAFEKEFSEYTGISHCVALSSGTAAMHLAVRYIIENSKLETRGDNFPPLVFASTLTFIGSVTPSLFEGCDITFIDCDQKSWNMDPELLEKTLAECRLRFKGSGVFL